MGLSKYDHVRQSKQSRGHTCHWVDCKKQVPPAMWGCKDHWYKLPKEIRDDIWMEYRAGQEERPGLVSKNYAKAARRAQDWIEAQIYL